MRLVVASSFTPGRVRRGPLCAGAGCVCKAAAVLNQPSAARQPASSPAHPSSPQGGGRAHLHLHDQQAGVPHAVAPPPGLPGRLLHPQRAGAHRLIGVVLGHTGGGLLWLLRVVLWLLLGMPVMLGQRRSPASQTKCALTGHPSPPILRWCCLAMRTMRPLRRPAAMRWLWAPGALWQRRRRLPSSSTRCGCTGSTSPSCSGA